MTHAEVPGAALPDPVALFALTGRTAVVTGAGRGLGRGMAEALAAAGAHVVLVSRSAQQLAAAAASISERGGRATPVAADITTDAGRSDVVAAAEAHGGADVVVHAAGAQLRKPARDVTPPELRRILEVNLEAGFFLSTALADGMIERSWGRHVFVGSLTSFLGLPGIAPYSASKSAVLGVVRTLAVEWAPNGVTVNAVVPGYFHTELTDALMQDAGRRDALLARIPQGRLGVAADLHGAVLFLASEASAYVTGTSIAVDGGWLAA